MINWDDYENFSEHEFTCKCGCGRTDMKADFLTAVQMWRTQIGHPVSVTSGFRCPEYNNTVSSTGFDGPHTTGQAADFSLHGEKAFYALRHAFTLGFTGIGSKQHGYWPSRFIHLDTLQTDNRPRHWTYS